MTHDDSLRRHLDELLAGGHAHATFDKVVADLPKEARGRTAPGMPHSPWMLVEHMRIAQGDILEFSRNAEHKSPSWPQGYWPASAEPPSDKAWNDAVAHWRHDLKAMRELVRDPKTDLYARIPWGERSSRPQAGQTVLREAMLVADHNSYHVGQLITLRRVLGVWPQ